MGFFSADMEPMIEIYQRETIELMEEYESRLLEAMKAHAFSADSINSIFRVVHTIKSSSAMMGMTELSTSTHRMEDLFLLFRDKPTRMRGNEARIFHLLDVYADFVKGEMERITEEAFAPSSTAQLLELVELELAFFRDPQPAADPINPAEPAVHSAAAAVPMACEPAPSHSSEQTFSWTIWFKRTCPMKNVRAFLLVGQIGPLCGELSHHPADLEAADANEQIAAEGFLLTGSSASPEAIRHKLLASPHIDHIDDQPSAPEPPPTPPSDEAQEAPVHAKPSRFGMISWDQIVHLQKITGELITANSILRTALRQSSQARDTELLLVQNGYLLRELEDVVHAVTLMPVSSAAPQYYRTVREICAREGKQVDFRVHGEDLEVDRNLLDAMAPPLIHLLRNAIDHGIEPAEQRLAAGKPETGTVELRVEALGSTLRFTLSDDGCGMNAQNILHRAQQLHLLTKPAEEYQAEEILDFIFAPGFSTTVHANQYSGRGVGMNVVRDVADSLNGAVSIRSTPGKGSSFCIEVPVSMTSIECIRFRVGTHVCLFPSNDVRHISSYRDAQARMQHLDGRSWLKDTMLIPVLNLFDLFGTETDGDLHLIVARGMNRSIAFITGPISGIQTAVEQPLPKMLEASYRKNLGISGCVIIEDGSLGLMLNPERLIRIHQKGVEQDAREKYNHSTAPDRGAK